jgi:glutathione S-transferase
VTDYTGDFKTHAESVFMKGVPADVAAGNYAKSVEKWFSHIEKRIKENGSTGFAVGDDLTNADICVWKLVDTAIDWLAIPGFQQKREDIEAKYPLIAEITAKVTSHPAIRVYLEKHWPVGKGKPPSDEIMLEPGVEG